MQTPNYYKTKLALQFFTLQKTIQINLLKANWTIIEKDGSWTRDLWRDRPTL